MKILAGEAVPVYGDGSNVRDWLHVRDHCRGIELILTRGRAGEVYNLGGECERRNLDLARTLCAIIDARLAASAAPRARHARTPAAHGARSEGLITYVRDRPGHDFRYAMDIAKARSELGFAPELTAERGFEQVVDWYLEHGARRAP